MLQPPVGGLEIGAQAGVLVGQRPGSLLHGAQPLQDLLPGPDGPLAELGDLALEGGDRVPDVAQLEMRTDARRQRPREPDLAAKGARLANLARGEAQQSACLVRTAPHRDVADGIAQAMI
jgi:hypothetical protein